MPLAYCDDCGPKQGLPIDDRKVGLNVVSNFYGACEHCGVTRACYGEDPSPQKPRQATSPTADQQWQHQGYDR